MRPLMACSVAQAPEHRADHLAARLAAVVPHDVPILLSQRARHGRSRQQQHGQQREVLKTVRRLTAVEAQNNPVLLSQHASHGRSTEYNL